MEPIYILILTIAALFTASLTVLKIFSMKRNPNSGRCPLHGQIENKIANIEQGLTHRQSISLCNERSEDIKEDLAEGRKQFKLVNDTLVEQGKLLARMDKAIEYLAVQNGFGNKK